MSKFEAGPHVPYLLPVLDAEMPGENLSSFHGALVGDIMGMIEQEPVGSDIRDIGIRAMAGLGLREALPYIDQAWLAASAESITEENKYRVNDIAYAYSDLGEFGSALVVADKIDGSVTRDPEHISFNAALYRMRTDKIPEAYLGRAIETITHSFSSDGALVDLYLLGDQHPKVRGVVLEAARQLVNGHILPEAESPGEVDESVAFAATCAARWGDMENAYAHFNNLHTLSWRLKAELQIARETGVLLGAQDMGQVYEEVTADDPSLTAATKAELLLGLRGLGHDVDGGVIWGILSGLDEDKEKVKLMADFVKAYGDVDARRQLVEHITEEYVVADPYELVYVAKELPGLLVECRPAILSALTKHTFDIQWEPGQLLQALLHDHLALFQLDEAIVLADSFEGKRLYSGFDKIDFAETIIADMAQKGRPYFNQALAMVGDFHWDPYSYGSLLAKFVAAGHDYLTPDERDVYMDACGGDFMKFCGWLDLAKATNRMDYLVQATSYLESEGVNTSRFASLDYRIKVLEAYEEIAAELEKAKA